MKRLLIFAVLFAGITACNRRAVLPSRDNIAAQFITIDTRRDTTLHMKDGLEIIIRANALSAPGHSARLEVKEALNIQTMISGGLVTKSNGQLLSSGGMFKIAPADDKKISFNAPITVKVPASNISPGMQLYDGVEKDGAINWENPRPLNDTAEKTNKLGQAIYENNCKWCHEGNLYDSSMDAPPLYGAIADWNYDTAAIFAYTNNNQTYLEEGRMRLGCNYFPKYHWTIGLGPISDDSLKAVFAFIEEDGRKRYGSPPVKSPCDSCRFYQWHLGSLKAYNYEGYTDTAATDFVTRTDTRTADTIPGDGKVMEAGTQNGEQAKASYYTVKIDNFGWKNVDEETRSLLTAAPSKLSVTVKGPSLPSMHIYLVIPQDKILSPGGLLDDGVSYGFYGTDSTVYLPQRTSAYVFAIAEDPDKKEFYFGKTAFTTDFVNNLTLQLQPAQPEAFEKFIQQAGGDKGLSAKVGTVPAKPVNGTGTALIKYYEQKVAEHCHNK
ncbi:cytochrome c [Chitinophaga sp. Cy-1792]|uniref:cytochrome c n=1 Tax=Chitinophaga sp. Cy-1792 TaxID=2608339 RepID=UPI00141EC815|nr:cytochrome c [Chitinophaga sp. Cy-1792]NIG54421.1 cytochrome c [Chitinophaga sp. Cy-1792]